MNKQAFLAKLESAAESIEFEDTINAIEANYDFTPTAFANGDCENAAGQNNGSCKILAFGLLNDLSVEKTLACFGRYYREDVLKNPEGDDHQNIRNFIKQGWKGVSFEGDALKTK